MGEKLNRGKEEAVGKFAFSDFAPFPYPFHGNPGLVHLSKRRPKARLCLRGHPGCTWLAVPWVPCSCAYHMGLLYPAVHLVPILPSGLLLSVPVSTSKGRACLVHIFLPLNWLSIAIRDKQGA